jgi:hypothetical protein
MRKTVTTGDSSSKQRFPLLALFAVTTLIGLAWICENPPSARNSGSAFSATQAISQLRTIINKEAPHPTGSLRNAQELDRIEKAIEVLGYRAERQSAFLCNDTNDCVQLQNLIVRIPGQTAGPAVLVDAHYDSVSAGPGVADNGSGVAIALEIARQIHAAPMLKYPVVLLFDDAEEQGLLGSQAFLNSPYARNVAWTINLDARGVRGPSLMYQTSKNNAALMKLYQSATHIPVANSLMSTVYEHLPSDTDFTNLSRHGIQGFNLAFLGGTAFYHRSGDTFEHLDPKSVQHQGEEALALTRALATDPPPLNAEGNAVYFDLFRYEIVWPKWMCVALTTLGVALLVFAASFRSQTFQVAALFRGAATLVLTLIVSAICGCALLWALYPHALLGPQFPAHPAPAILAFSALGLAVAVWIFSLVPTRALTREYLVGYWSTLSLAGVALFFLLFGASYIATAPVLVAALLLAVAVLLGIDRPVFAVLAISGSLLGAGLLWIPLLRLLYLGEGELALPLICCVLSVVFLLVLPYAWPRRVYLQRIAIGATLIVAMAALITSLVPVYNAAAPMPLNLFCVQSEAGPSHWVFLLPKKYVSKIPDLMRTGGFVADPHPETLLPWVSPKASLYSSAAATPSLPSVEMRLLSKDASATSTCFNVRLISPPEVDRIVLWFPPTTRVQSISIGGQALTNLSSLGWKRFSSTPMDGGLDINFCLDPKGGTALYLNTVEYGLPPAGLGLVQARGTAVSESQDGDMTYRLQRIKFPTS